MNLPKTEYAQHEVIIRLHVENSDFRNMETWRKQLARLDAEQLQHRFDACIKQALLADLGISIPEGMEYEVSSKCW